MRNDVRKSANERPLIEMSKSTYGPPKGIVDCCKHNLYPVNVMYILWLSNGSILSSKYLNPKIWPKFWSKMHVLRMCTTHLGVLV